MKFTFNIQGDFKTEFKNYVDLLFSKVATFTRTQRNGLVDGLIEAYVATTGQVPNGGQLDRLASFILHEELTSNDPYKTSKTGIMSDRQFRRRAEEQEADVKLAGNYGTDGKKHGRSTRNRSTNELD